MDKDRNFDDITGKFKQNIYGTTKGKIREIIVWQDIETILANFPDNQKLTILDAGGGQGQIACKLAKLGHHVTVCDISEQMLKIAKSNAESQNLHLDYIHCAIQDLKSYIPDTFDIVICHAVLEWISEPLSFLSSLKAHLKPDGYLSLMFYNYHGLLFRTATLGNFGYLQAGLKKRKKKTLSPDFPRNPDDVYHWLSEINLNIIQKTGVRIFHDYMIDKTKRENRFDELLAAEKQFCRQEPYLNLARYIHLIVQNKT